MTDKADIAKMVEMRREGKSYGAISQAFGKKYPAWSRWHILHAAPEMREEVPEAARVHRPTADGKPRVTAIRRPMYDMDIEYRHGDGKFYGCGEIVIVTRLYDGVAGNARDKAAMLKHKLACKKGEKA